MSIDPKQMQAAFLEAAQAAPAERSAILDRVCAEDAELRRRVELLLRAHDDSADLPPAAGDVGKTAAYVPREQPGTVVAGRYKLLEQIGEGGMGTVWVAEQTQPVRRKVALKLIKAGMDSKSVLARFEAERQALAVMDHPNIAKVLDGGLTETGRPFFVMEYVKGVRITEYCDATRMSVPERLQLFVQVCQAVQHAHQKGIIHRDLKPSNILVAPYDDRPVPKVIDFGLAKAMHQPLTELTLHTAHETVLGTPLYMSPEQAQLNNLDVDTRSDLYSLGVLLYELLTGTTPLEKQRFKEAAWDEIRRVIREEEPPRPSMRLSSSEALPSLAAGRQIEPARLTKLVRGELDWIVMKSLEKDRTRRYETANGFAMDIQRYLAGEPVLAAPPSSRYRLRKFARKHRAALTTAAAMIVLFLAAAAFSTLQAVRATRALRKVVATQRERALAQVDALRTAEISQVPYLIEGLKPFRDEIGPQLRQSLQGPELGEKEHLRLSLAIVAEDEAQVPYLADRLLSSEPAELLVIRDSLFPYRDELVTRLWQIAEDPAVAKDRCFRALCALAAYTPEDLRWNKVCGDVAAQLVTENSLVLGKWIDALRPVSGFLVAPLADMIQDESVNDSRKIAAGDVYAGFAAYDPTQFRELEKRLAVPIPVAASDEQKIKLAKQKANVAGAFLRMNQYERMRGVLKHSPDPTARSYLIHLFGPLAIDQKIIWKKLESEKEVSVRRALVLGLGELDPDQLRPAVRQAVISQLVRWYLDDPDPGMHGATEWLLRLWKQDAMIEAVTKELATGKVEGNRLWYTTRQGQTMVLIPGPVEIRGGQIRIAQSFAIADKPVTVEQFLRFRKEHFGLGTHSILGSKGNEPLSPVDAVTWYEAAAYCNWLSEQEGIPENQRCYEPNSAKSYSAGMKIRLGRQGYRLPGEWEWEYACRAGSVTDYYFGQSVELLGRYAWYNANSYSRLWPVGMLRPNDLGLFDMHGLISNWCQGAFVSKKRRGAMYSETDGEIVDDNALRVSRNQGYLAQPHFVRSAVHTGGTPGHQTLGDDGFRLARNLPPLIPLQHTEGETDVNVLKIKSPLDEAIAIYRQAIGRHPNDAAAHIRLATAYQAAGRTRESVPLLAKASSASPFDTILSLQVAALQAWFGQEKEYGETCTHALEFAKGSSDPTTADRMSKICCLRPTQDKTRLQSSLALAREAVELGKNDGYLPWFQMSLGMAEYRSGNYAAANQALLTAAKSFNTNRYGTVTSAFYRAMSLFRQGKPDEARKLAAEAAAQMNPLPKDESNPLAGDNVGHDDLIVWLAYKEAMALISFDAAPAARVQPDGK